jgi:hypothetical protein
MTPTKKTIRNAGNFSFGKKSRGLKRKHCDTCAGEGKMLDVSKRPAEIVDCEECKGRGER